MINGRRRYGDWEGDTIVGQGRRSALLTLVERKSGYTRIGRVDSMKSDMTMHVAKRRMKDLPPCLRRSVTFDNGKEFAEHQKLTRRLGLQVYFTEAYASWQRGTNENTNGLLRQYFPKGIDFTQVSHREVPAWNNHSTNVLAKDSAIEHLRKSSPQDCVAIDS